VQLRTLYIKSALVAHLQVSQVYAMLEIVQVLKPSKFLCLPL